MFDVYWKRKNKSILVENINALRIENGALLRYAKYCDKCIDNKNIPKPFDWFSKRSVLRQAILCFK